jgi:hypothetical protein
VRYLEAELADFAGELAAMAEPGAGRAFPPP